MSFGGRLRGLLDDFEYYLEKLPKYESPYRESVLHFEEDVILKQLERIKKLTEKTIEDIKKQKGK